ncbi:hypothetical protein B0E51_10980 [Rhodanobacter sp. C05]|nr:hypothetical protein B0E51_10980 [Rhodanobacter sp. C05]
MQLSIVNRTAYNLRAMFPLADTPPSRSDAAGLRRSCPVGEVPYKRCRGQFYLRRQQANPPSPEFKIDIELNDDFFAVQQHTIWRSAAWHGDMRRTLRRNLLEHLPTRIPLMHGIA